MKDETESLKRQTENASKYIYKQFSFSVELTVNIQQLMTKWMSCANAGNDNLQKLKGQESKLNSKNYSIKSIHEMGIANLVSVNIGKFTKIMTLFLS